MRGVLRWTAVDGKCVLAVVDGPPVLDPGFETRLDLPVLDQVLDQVRKTAGGVVGALRCGVQIGLATFSAGIPRRGYIDSVPYFLAILGACWNNRVLCHFAKQLRL